ncbi:O-antigen polymerase [Vibrio sp. 10N.247.311.14]|uniref:O-antigen polymerase n=1 Tax=Vibrio sp. 10N.247.311.14 TaxID=3229994 RepID=UPI003550A569
MKFISALLIFSIPFWSLPFIPGTYSAISPYLAGLLGFIFVFGSRVSFSIDTVLYTLFFIFLLVSYSLYSIYVGHFNVIFLSAYVIGLLCYPGFYFSFRILGKDKIRDYLLLLSRIVSIFAIIEFLMSKIGFLSHVKSLLTLILTGSAKQGFVLTTNELSWAVQLLLFASIFIYVNYKDRENRFDFFLLFTNFLIILVSFSLTAISVLIISLSFYYLVFRRVSLTNVLKFIIAVSVFVSVFIFIFKFWNQGGYTFSRISKLYDIELYDLKNAFYYIISVDNSLLVRIGYPFVAVNMIIDNPVGYGISGFSYYLKDYTDLIATPTMYLSELPRHLENLNADPRNLILRLGVDFGIFGIFLFLCVFFSRVKICSSLSRDKLLATLLISLSFGAMMQFSTFYFFLYPFTIAYVTFLRDY